MPVVRRTEVPDFKGMGKGAKDLMRALPDIAAISAINFFQDRFEQGGWIDKGGLEHWDERKDSNRAGTLMNVSGFLKNAFDYDTGKDWANVRNYAPYSSIHNDGGVIAHPGGTHYVIIGSKAAFISKTKAQELKDKGITVKKTKPHLIKIPQRQFMGESEFFMKRMERNLQENFEKIELKFM